MIELKNLIDENEALLLKYYNKSLRELKKLILESALKGNDTTHLKALRRNIEYEIIELNNKFYYYSVNTSSNLYKQGYNFQDEKYDSVSALASFSGVNKEALIVIATNTYKPLGKVTELIGRDCRQYLARTNFKEAQSVLKGLCKFLPDSNELRKSGIINAGQIVRGDISWQKAMRQIRDEFVSKDIFNVPYFKKDGSFSHFVSMKDYAKMVARTTSAEAFRIGEQNSILETFADDGDLVEIIGRSRFPKSPCIPYEGKILSLKGLTDGYQTISEAKAKGLFHPNCIHHFGVTKNVIKEYKKLKQA